jgi:hypothetical protein
MTQTLLSTTRCSKRNIADSTQDSLPTGKRLHSQTIRTLPSAYNDQLTSNEVSEDKTSMNKRKREKCPYNKTKVSQVSRNLGKPFRNKIIQQSTSGNAQLTKSSDNCDVNQTQVLPDLIRVMRPYLSTSLNNKGTGRITVRDEMILKRLAPDGCNTLTRRPQKRRRAMP